MAYRLGKLLLKKVWNTCIQVKVRNRLSYAMRSRTAPIPCPSPPLPAGSPSVHSNGARERTLQGAVTTARRGDYQNDGRFWSLRLTYGTASTMTFNGSVNDVFLTYGEKCVLSPNTDNKSLNGLFHFYGHQKQVWLLHQRARNWLQVSLINQTRRTPFTKLNRTATRKTQKSAIL